MPEKVAIQVPRLGLTVEEVKIAEWLVADGQNVNKGDIVCLIETDKATNEIEAPASGKLSRSADIEDIREVGAEIGFILSNN